MVEVCQTTVSANEDVKYLGELEVTKDEHALLYCIDQNETGGKINVGGIEYDRGILTHPDASADSVLIYSVKDLGYTHFRAIGGKDASAGQPTYVEMKVYVDGELRADSGAITTPSVYNFNVNIEGASELKLVVTNGGDGHPYDATSWADAKLVKTQATSIEIANSIRRGYAIGQEIDCTGAEIKVTYADGYENTVPVSKSMVSGFDSSKAGKQTVTITYEGNTTDLDVFVDDGALDLTTVTPDYWKVYGGTSDSPAPTYTVNINTAFNSSAISCIADVEYLKSFGVHPEGDGVSLVTFNVENLDYDFISVVAGKDRDAGAGVGIAAIRNGCPISFDILVDDVVVESSPIMYYGDAHHFFIDISNAKTVTLRTNAVDSIMCDSASWGNPILLNASLGKLESFVISPNYKAIYKHGEALNLYNAELIYTYESGEVVKTPASVDMVTGFDANKEGKQTLTVTDQDGNSCTIEVEVTKKATYLSDLDWVDAKTHPGEGQVYKNTNSAGGKISIAGVTFDKGFRYHPADDGIAEIKYDISGLNHTTFAAFVGKDAECAAAVIPTGTYVRFELVGDGEVIATTPDIVYGDGYYFTADITGVKELILRVDAVDGIYCDASSWGDVILSGEAPTQEPENPPTGDMAVYSCFVIIALLGSTIILFKKRVNG